MLLVFRAVLGRLKETWQKPAEFKVKPGNMQIVAA
jgi:hypothetical protein